MKKLTVRDLVLCALMAALLAVCAWISFPVLEIAYTLQTFGVFFALLVLGGARGTLAILVYILLGAVGLPPSRASRALSAASREMRVW